MAGGQKDGQKNTIMQETEKELLLLKQNQTLEALRNVEATLAQLLESNSWDTLNSSFDAFVGALKADNGVLLKSCLFLPKFFGLLLTPGEQNYLHSPQSIKLLKKALTAVGAENFPPSTVWAVMLTLLNEIKCHNKKIWEHPQNVKMPHHGCLLHCTDKQTKITVPVISFCKCQFSIFRNNLMALIAIMVKVCKSAPPKDLLMLLDEHLLMVAIILSDCVKIRFNDYQLVTMMAAVISAIALKGCLKDPSIGKNATYQKIINDLVEPVRSHYNANTFVWPSFTPF